MIPTLIAQFGETGLKPENPAKSGLASFDLNADPLTEMERFISQIIGLITTIGSIIFIVMFLYSALKWITAGGDSSKVEKARDGMVQGVIGLVIMVGAYGIIGLIGTAIGINILNPADQIREIFGVQGPGVTDWIMDGLGLLGIGN